jgi:hypothetical protein
MSDPDTAQRAHEWLERQLEELAQLRNATRRDSNFKAWRQATLTVIQRVWPGDVRRVERFRRIPFSPPMTHATDKQVRDYYGRGWGEAGVLLREFLAEINLVGVSESSEVGAQAGAEAGAGMEPMPPLSPEPDPGPPPAIVPHETPAPRPATPILEGPRGDFIGRAMAKLFSDSPVFRGIGEKPPAAPAETIPAVVSRGPARTIPAIGSTAPAETIPAVASPGPVRTIPAIGSTAPAETIPAVASPGPARTIPAIGSTARARAIPAVGSAAPAETIPAAGPAAAELLRLAGELDRLGLSPAQAVAARDALVALASAQGTSPPTWKLVQAALQHAVATPALARRALPLLIGFLDRAA